LAAVVEVFDMTLDLKVLPVFDLIGLPCLIADLTLTDLDSDQFASLGVPKTVRHGDEVAPFSKALSEYLYFDTPFTVGESFAVLPSQFGGGVLGAGDEVVRWFGGHDADPHLA
jgi:hypothetical protein